MWVFYVNRGQGIASFGIENKDNAILEFLPANEDTAFLSPVIFSNANWRIIGKNSSVKTGFHLPWQPVRSTLREAHQLQSIHYLGM